MACENQCNTLYFDDYYYSDAFYCDIIETQWDQIRNCFRNSPCEESAKANCIIHKQYAKAYCNLDVECFLTNLFLGVLLSLSAMILLFLVFLAIVVIKKIEKNEEQEEEEKKKEKEKEKTFNFSIEDLEESKSPNLT